MTELIGLFVQPCTIIILSVSFGKKIYFFCYKQNFYRTKNHKYVILNKKRKIVQK